MKEIRATQLKKGHVVLLPFKKTATVKSTRTGTEFVTVKWDEPYQDSRYHVNQQVLVADDA